MKLVIAALFLFSSNSAFAGEYFSNNDRLDRCVSIVISGWRAYPNDDTSYFAGALFRCSNDFAETQAEVNRVREMASTILNN